MYISAIAIRYKLVTIFSWSITTACSHYHKWNSSCTGSQLSSQSTV